MFHSLPGSHLMDLAPGTFNPQHIMHLAPHGIQHGLTMHIDVSETPNEYRIQADLPGFKKDDIDINLSDTNLLTISAERKEDQEDENQEWHIKERRRGTVKRCLRLPKNIDEESIRATYDNGCLSVMIEKKPEHKREEKKSIKITENYPFTK